MVQFNVTFNSAVLLPGDHYFFIPQVEFDNGGQFYWLSASRPITGAGTTPISPDLQAWVRNAALDPDWSRVGTDIIGGASAPTFNIAFALDGSTVPEPGAMEVAGAALLLMGVMRRGR